MTILRDFNDLKHIFEMDGAVVLYGAGRISRDIVACLELWGYEEKVHFITVKDLDDNPTMIGDIPVVEIDAMFLYKEDRVIIATEMGLAREIEPELIRRGYEYIYCIASEVTDDLKKNESRVIEKLKINHNERILRKMENIECKIEQQNEISEVNLRAFSELKNCNTGREVVVFGTGPSSTNYIPIKDAVHIGVNRAWKRKDIVFEYYFIQDACYGRDNQLLPILEESIIKCRLFVGTYLKRRSYYSDEFSMAYEANHDNIYRYYIDCIYNREERGYRYYPNICHHPLLDFGSVIFPAIQFALFTNPKRLYLVGCDATLGPQFFRPEEELDDSLTSFPDNWKIGYTQMKAYALLNYPNTEIISINPVSLKGLFKDIYT